MRIKFGHCSAQEIADTLKIFEEKYGLDFTSVNLYCSFAKGSHVHKFYNQQTNEDAIITAGNNIILEKQLENLSCVDSPDFMFLQKVSDLVNRIDPEYNILMIDYLCQLLEFVPEGIEPNHFNFEEEDQRLFMKRTRAIMETIGVRPPKIVDYYSICDAIDEIIKENE